MWISKQRWDLLNEHCNCLTEMYIKNMVENSKEKVELLMEIEKLKENNQKPPLGIMPRYIWDESRLIQLEQAIERRIWKVNTIPIEWIEERNELIERLNKRK